MIETYRDYTPEIDKTCYIAPGSSVIGNVAIGSHSSVWHHVVIRGDIEKITVGNYTNIQDGCVLHCVKGVELCIGDYVTVGHGAILHSAEIGENTLIGMGAVVLDGAKIGRSCLIAAGTVVTPNTVIPDGQMVMGSPGKIKRPLTEEEIRNMKENAEEYIRLADEYKQSRQV